MNDPCVLGFEHEASPVAEAALERAFPMKLLPGTFLTLAAFGLSGGGAPAFEIDFDWGDIPLCTSGYPNIVPNPRFVLRNVPPGTRYILFRMQDLNVPQYDHGGGIVPYEGQTVIEPGAFTYKSPCPPNGRHIYEWTAWALESEEGGVLGVAKARRAYPE